MAKKSISNSSVRAVHQRVWWLLAIFILVCGLFIFHSATADGQHAPIKSFTFSANNGPVSPKFQGSQTLTFSANSCSYVVSSFDVERRKTITCNMNQSTFDKIIDSYYRNKIESAIKNNNAKPPSRLMGAPERNLIVTHENGSILETNLTQAFLTDAQSFFDTVAQFIPQFGEFNF